MSSRFALASESISPNAKVIIISIESEKSPSVFLKFQLRFQDWMRVLENNQYQLMAVNDMDLEIEIPFFLARR